MRFRRQDHQEIVLAVARLVLGLLFLGAGLGKLAIPSWRETWASLLAASRFPWADASLWVGPAAEILAGALLLTGFLARVGALAAAVMMILALVLHAHAGTASVEVPAGLTILAWFCALVALLVAWRGAGAWSVDGKRHVPR